MTARGAISPSRGAGRPCDPGAPNGQIRSDEPNLLAGDGAATAGWRSHAGKKRSSRNGSPASSPTASAQRNSPGRGAIACGKAGGRDRQACGSAPGQARCRRRRQRRSCSGSGHGGQVIRLTRLGTFLGSHARQHRRRLRRHRHQPALRVPRGAARRFGRPWQPGRDHIGVVPRETVLGVLSLIVWALILVVTIKYVLILLRADNNGEGGTLSLMALAQRVLGRRAAAHRDARHRSARPCSTATASSRPPSRCCRPWKA